MVAKGQFLERPTLISTEHSLVLEGMSHRGTKRPPLLVLPPPAAEGGGMDHVVAAEIVYAAASRGYPTLRFNYRGVGGSQGTRDSTPKTLMQDARAAYGLALENNEGATPVIATLGASDAVALQLSNDHAVAGIIFVNPSLVGPEEVEHVKFEVSVVMPENDAAQPREAWGALLARREAHFTVVPLADRTYQRNLVMVGRAVADFLAKVEQTLAML